MSNATMPERWDIGPYERYMVQRDGGDYVKAEDVEPLVAEITRLRARVEELEKVRAAAQALDGYAFDWVHWYEKFATLRAALEAKP